MDKGNPNLLRWPGGKQWAVKRLVPLVRVHLSGTYFEPFLGGGALYFALRPNRAILSDINPELINTYRMVREHPRAVIRRLRRMSVSAKSYYIIRAEDGGSEIERAARFLYLNRTCFGGIYRLNQEGRFNVPYGGGDRNPALLWERGVLLSAAEALGAADLEASDFEPVIDRAKAGDVVYCDPTYTVTHDHNGFIRYNERNFSWSDQERLSLAISRAHKRGATIVLTNAHHRLIRRLFDAPRAWILHRHSSVSCSAEFRRPVSEYLLLWPGEAGSEGRL